MTQMARPAPSPPAGPPPRPGHGAPRGIEMARFFPPRTRLKLISVSFSSLGARCCSAAPSRNIALILGLRV